MSVGGRDAIASSMQTAFVVLACLALSSPGCAFYLANQGTELANLRTRAAVHEAFGEPAEVRAVGGDLREVYLTRRKVARNSNMLSHIMMDVITLGAAEVVLVPCELGRAGYHCVKGQRIEFTYDAADAVTLVSYNGLYSASILGPGWYFTEVTPQYFGKSPSKADALGAVLGAALPGGHAHNQYLKR